MQKLHLALDVYRGLGTNPSTRVDTLTKVISMLLHPFPKVNARIVSQQLGIPRFLTHNDRSASQQLKHSGS